MLSAVVAALACLCLARPLPAEPYNLRYVKSLHNSKDLSGVLATIEERLRVLDTISVAQAKQARRLDVIQDKLDRVETTLSLRLERAQLAAERLEHRLHMLQTNVQASIKESSEKLEKSQTKITELAQNLTKNIESHIHLLEKVNGAYADTWHRGLVIESLMRDGLSLVNVTRRELADGLRALARRQRDARLTSAELEAAFTRRLNDNTYKIDLKMQEVLDAQKRFVDSCQRVQQDEPRNVADVLDKLIDSLINTTTTTFHELQSIQMNMKNHDGKVMKLFNTGRVQNDATCRRLEGVFRNASHTTFKEHELHQLTEKFIALTDRADAALQKLEDRLGDDPNEQPLQPSDVTAEADRLLLKLEGIKTEKSEEDPLDDDEDEDDDQNMGYFNDGGGGSDLMGDDLKILMGERKQVDSATAWPPHRRHLHKHPYDRGPGRKNQPS